MKLSDPNCKTLMLSLHQLMETYASYASDNLNKGLVEDALVYPSNTSFTESEKAALLKLKNDSILSSALKKLLKDNSAGVLFDLLNLIDGTADPAEDLGDWTGIALVDQSEAIEENPEMLHDAFFSSYRDWASIHQKN